MISKKYKQTNTMVGNNVCLRKLTINDLHDLHKNCSSDRDVARYVCWNYCKNISVTERNIMNWISKYKNDYYFLWGIENAFTGELIGIISVVETDFINNSCEVGYCLGKKWWSKGYTTESLMYVLNYLLFYVGFEKVICKAQSRNIASIKVMKKCGMQYESKIEHYIDKYTGEEDCVESYTISKSQFIKFNNINYNYSKLTFDDCKDYYLKMYRLLFPEINNINNQLIKLISNSNNISNYTIKKYCSLLNQRKKVLFDYISDSVKFFSPIIRCPITIYVNGSYSRNSQRVFSDIDLNYMYPNRYIKKMIPIEDIISFSLANIFNIKYKDRIHPMGYLTLINDYQLKKSNYYTILFSNGDMFICKCRDNSYDILFENINMPRSHSEICKYIGDQNNIKYINEYVYNYDIIFSNTHDYLKNVIKKTDRQIINNNAFNYYLKLNIKKMIDDINYQINNLSNKVLYVKEFKKKYKTVPLSILYELFAIYRRIELKEKGNLNSEMIKVDLYFIKLKYLGININIINNLRKSYYQYIFELNRIEKIFNDLGISFSSHSDSKIDEISLAYKKIYNNRVDKNISLYLSELYNNLLTVLYIINGDD